MDNMKIKIRQQLIANVLMEKCAQRDHLIFQSSWCSQERVIRFTTKNSRRLFPVTDQSGGNWKTGDEIMYEVENGDVRCMVNCIYAPIGVSLMPEGCLKSWDITDSDANALFHAFDTLVDKTIPLFEKQLEEKMKAPEVFVEGEEQLSQSIKYERNPKARMACLAHYGYTCRICGMNFEQVYGPEFKDIIEVHHIVPLSQISKDYVVDPVRDLIPVCPNCHTAIHSKFGHTIQIVAK